MEVFFLLGIFSVGTSTLNSVSLLLREVHCNHYYYTIYVDSIPIVDKFNFDDLEIVYVGGSINLTVEYFSNVLTFTWNRFHADLPPGNHIIDYSANGKKYSSLILFTITTDDWGVYIFTANSHCGTSTLNVTLEIASGEVCQ